MTTETALNPMGLKRICTNCGDRFYDINKRPIICPSCGEEFTIEAKLKTRRGRSASVVEAKETPQKKATGGDSAKKAILATKTDEDEISEDELEDEGDDVDKISEDELEDEDDDVEAVSLDDVDKSSADDDKEKNSVLEDEDTLDDIPDFEGEIDDDLGDDDTLLEKEDDD